LEAGDLPFELDEDGISADSAGMLVARMRDPDGSSPSMCCRRWSCQDAMQSTNRPRNWFGRWFDEFIGLPCIDGGAHIADCASWVRVLRGSRSQRLADALSTLDWPATACG
jgi:hypothetical protein